MASKKEEEFCKQFIKDINGLKVFEFGPGNCAFAESLPNTEFISIDLYEFSEHDPSRRSPNENIDYRVGNFLDMDLENLREQFDAVVCLSSLEHAGIERKHINDGTLDPDEHIKVAEKLSSLLKPGGYLLVTMPGGKNRTFYVSSGYGDTTQFDRNNSEWGYRVFNEEGAKSLFKEEGLELVKEEAFKLGQDNKYKELDYFKVESWEPINTELNNLSDYTKIKGLIMLAFRKK